MSVSHPYLKHLKVHIIRFCEQNGPIRDDHESLLPFCRTLEDIFKMGLTGSRGKFSTEIQRTYWQWLNEMLGSLDTRKLTATLSFCLQYAHDSKKAITATGKGRLFLRCALNKKMLCKCIRLLRQENYLLQEFYDSQSILGNEILSELLLSLLAQLEAQVSFSLNFRIQSFLDETWELPTFRQHELVPCTRLGVDLLAVRGRIVVCEVEPDSVADEDCKIEAGDILDDLFGEPLRRANIKKVVTLMDEYRGSPIYVSVVKCLSPSDQFYRPLYSYLDDASLCKRAIMANRQRRKQLNQSEAATSLGQELLANERTAPLAASDMQMKTGTGCYKVKMCGFVYVGQMGTVEQIENGVVNVLKLGQQKRAVVIELAETEVAVHACDSNTILLRHSYPEVSSCGRRVDFPLNFSYIAGETTCTFAKKFFCYVFEASNEEQSKTILKGIAEGFERTHWAV